MRPRLNANMLPLTVNGEHYWILDGSDDHPMRLQHVEDPQRIITLTDDELIAGLANQTIRFAYLRKRGRQDG
jgi:hypothetical protein